MNQAKLNKMTCRMQGLRETKFWAGQAPTTLEPEILGPFFGWRASLLNTF